MGVQIREAPGFADAGLNSSECSLRAWHDLAWLRAEAVGAKRCLKDPQGRNRTQDLALIAVAGEIPRMTGGRKANGAALGPASLARGGGSARTIRESDRCSFLHSAKMRPVGAVSETGDGLWKERGSACTKNWWVNVRPPGSLRMRSLARFQGAVPVRAQPFQTAGQGADRLDPYDSRVGNSQGVASHANCFGVSLCFIYIYIYTFIFIYVCNAM